MALMGYWSFDGAVSDKSGKVHDAVLGSSISYVTAQRNQGVDFPADTNSVVTVADHADLRLKTNFSVRVIMKPDAITTDAGTNRRIIGKADDASNAWLFIIRSDTSPTGRMYFAVNRAGTTTARETAGTIFAVGTVYDVVITVAGTTYVFYVNNVVQAHASTVVPTYTTAPNIVMGRNTSASGRYDGWLDEFRFYDHTLSAGEVSQLYYNSLDKLLNISTAQMLRKKVTTPLLRSKATTRMLRKKVRVNQVG